MSQPEWLQWYRSGKCAWKQVQLPHGQEKKTYFARQLGVVESSFDDDGRYYVGRADIDNLMTFQLPKTFDVSDIQERVKSVWSVIRAHHLLLRARAVEASEEEVLRRTNLEGRCFLLENIDSTERLVRDAENSIVFLEDFYHDIDIDLFHRHSGNTARLFDSHETLSKLYVFPLEKQANGQYNLRVLLVLAHMISDGITMFNVISHFGNLLNFSAQSNHSRLDQLAKDINTVNRLPPAQEELYPPVAPGNIARSRWLWAISRILRHTRKPPPDAFTNPLRRTQPRSSAEKMPVKFGKVLDYSVTPPLNSFCALASLSRSATKRLLRLCGESNISFGSGCFTLVGLVMMEMYEEFYPSVAREERLPYVVSFPVNPRPFFQYSNSRDHGSCMLAFSDGVSMPYLPSDLPLEGRFKVLAKQTHRQLNLYQKRARGPEELKKLGARSAAQLIPSTYISTVERVEAKRPEEHRRGINPQGAYPPSASKSGYTNGVSAVGFRKPLMVWDGNELSVPWEERVKLIESHGIVRVRDNEFLVGTAADAEVLHVGVSFDGNYVDEEKVERWKERVKSILEPDASPNL